MGNLRLQDGEVERFNGMSASDVQIGGTHYKDCVIQPSEFIFKNGLTWCEGNAIKYICRHHRKHGVKDIDKAIHYLELLKEWEYGKEESVS
jgi:hypothetical protein